jgi:hypothetical protein
MGLLKHAILIKSYSRSQRTTLLPFGFAILLMHFHLFKEERRYKIGHEKGNQIGMNHQSNLRGEQLLESLILLFYTE